jgi:hypothetical protein
VYYAGLDCALKDVDECSSDALNDCHFNGSVCENLDARASMDAPTHRCVCRGACALADTGSPSAFMVHLTLVDTQNQSLNYSLEEVETKLYAATSSLVEGALLAFNINMPHAIARVADWYAMQALRALLARTLV